MPSNTINKPASSKFGLKNRTTSTSNLSKANAFSNNWDDDEEESLL